MVDDASPDGTGALAERLAATRSWMHVLHRPAQGRPRQRLPRRLRVGARARLRRRRPARRRSLASPRAPAAHARGARARRRPRARLALRARRRQRRLAAPPPHRQPHRLRARRRARSACPTPISPAGSSSGAPPRWPPSTSPPRRSQGYVFQVETTQRAHRAGLRIVELPFTFRDRTAGQSKMRASIAFEGVRMVARLRRDGWKPQRVASAVRTGA